MNESPGPTRETIPNRRERRVWSSIPHPYLAPRLPRTCSSSPLCPISYYCTVRQVVSEGLSGQRGDARKGIRTEYGYLTL
jgi:hypothetical protein